MYTDSPQCKIVATSCAACGRPLVDAVSVETGLGPDCRRKYMSGFLVEKENRKEANKIVHQIAVSRNKKNDANSIFRLRELGFIKLSDKLQKRCCSVIIEEHGSYLSVQAPYCEYWGDLKGRKWDHENKKNLIPLANKKSLWDFLRKYYKGCFACGPKGAFIIA